MLFLNKNLYFDPSVDIYENKERIAFQIDLPGMTQEDIKVLVEDNILTISGERPYQNGEKYHRRERGYGKFTRSFNLPKYIDSDNVEAVYTAGVLNLTLPKREVAKAIPITVS